MSVETCHGNSMISDYYTNENVSDCVGFTLPGIIDDPGSLEGKINSNISILDPILKILH